MPRGYLHVYLVTGLFLESSCVTWSHMRTQGEAEAGPNDETDKIGKLFKKKLFTKILSSRKSCIMFRVTHFKKVYSDYASKPGGDVWHFEGCFSYLGISLVCSDLAFWCQINEAFRLNRPFALLTLLRRHFERDGVGI